MAHRAGAKSSFLTFLAGVSYLGAANQLVAVSSFN
uniref:Uncharacterized protein n=1 Tax=Arundo donax TaxID=35708 RepID=A0A0A8Z1X1_ARUDO